MIRSMTGFGQGSRSSHGFKLQIDLKSVNHRYGEVIVRMPREWLTYEDILKKTIQQTVKRGRVDAFVQVEREGQSDKAVEVDWLLVDQLHQAASQIQQRLRISAGLTLQDVLAIPDVIRLRENAESSFEWMESELVACAQEAIDHLIRMREAEGKHLFADLTERLQLLDNQQQIIAQLAPTVVEEYRLKLQARIKELMIDDVSVDEQRLAMEVALFADRSNIDEELTRLKSHFHQFRQLLTQDEPVGRKLDFLIQEMNREVNTIGSKASHVAIITRVVDMKAELEKIREQVQNIE